MSTQTTIKTYIEDILQANKSEVLAMEGDG